jgi:hypothetical protein
MATAPLKCEVVRLRALDSPRSLTGLFLTFRRPFLELARLQSRELIDGRPAHPIAA